MLNFLFKAKPRKDGSKNVVNETGFRRNTRIKMRSFCRFCRFAFANHSDVCFFHYFGTSRFTTRTEDHWRSRFLQSRCRRILTHLQIIQSPSSQCSSSSQELQRESPPRPGGTEQAERICQQVKSASFKDFGRPGLPIFLRSPFAFHFLCQFSSLLLPFVFDLIQEFPFCSERLGLLASNPSGQHEETDPASKFEVKKFLVDFNCKVFFLRVFCHRRLPGKWCNHPVLVQFFMTEQGTATWQVTCKSYHPSLLCPGNKIKPVLPSTHSLSWLMSSVTSKLSKPHTSHTVVLDSLSAYHLMKQRAGKRIKHFKECTDWRDPVKELSRQDLGNWDRDCGTFQASSPAFRWHPNDMPSFASRSINFGATFEGMYLSDWVGGLT